MSQQLLHDHILGLSYAWDWEDAIKEWQVTGVYWDDDGRHCPCSVAIKEVCVIRNDTTGAGTEVGNVCVNHFMGIAIEPVFADLRKIRKDVFKGLGVMATEFFHQRGLLDKWQRDFLFDTHGRRRCSAKVLQHRARINTNILRAVHRKGLCEDGPVYTPGNYM